MERPEKVEVKCAFCGFDFDVATGTIAETIVIFRDPQQTAEYKVSCTNCDHSQIIDLPKKWFKPS